jgi:hypothetical protein
MPTYEWDIPSRGYGSHLGRVSASGDRESTAISHWLTHDRRTGAQDDDRAGYLITRASDLTRDLALSRSLARRDLSDSGYYDVFGPAR